VAEWLPAKRAAFEVHRSQHVHRASFERLALRDEEYYFVAVRPAAPVASAPVGRREDRQ
jgi:hypothetical protein